MIIKKNGTAAGFSLIELIIALSLLGLLVSIFLPVIIDGFRGINTAGQSSQQIYQLQQQIESSLVTSPTQKNSTMTIPFSYAGKSVIVSGEKQDIDSSSSTFPIKVTLFRPLK